MAVIRPYRRTLRQFADGTYEGHGGWRCIADPRYAEVPHHYIRSFLLLQDDLREIFDYLEPADTNLNCYSYRIHALLLRACVEVEANCKAILRENGYARSGDWTMRDYKKINATHRLSSFKVILPHWTGIQGTRAPFGKWATGGALSWYDAYNASKHDRHAEFSKATLGCLIDSVCGLLSILSAQFMTEDFSGQMYWVRSGSQDGTQRAIGNYFRVSFPTDFPIEQRYDFDWKALKNEPEPFQKFDYASI